MTTLLLVRYRFYTTAPQTRNEYRASEHNMAECSVFFVVFFSPLGEMDPEEATLTL